MGLFGRKKEPELLNLSSVQLVNILKKAILLAEEDVNARSYTLGPEIMFEYHDTIHFIGVKYDKKRAKAAKQKVFCAVLGISYRSIYDRTAENIRLLYLFLHKHPFFPKTLQKIYLPTLP